MNFAAFYIYHIALWIIRLHIQCGVIVQYWIPVTVHINPFILYISGWELPIQTCEKNKWHTGTSCKCLCMSEYDGGNARGAYLVRTGIWDSKIKEARRHI